MASKKTSIHQRDDESSYNKWDEASSDTEEENYESMIENNSLKTASSRMAKSKKGTTTNSATGAKRSTRKNSSPKIDLSNRSSLTSNRSARDSGGGAPVRTTTKSKKKSKSKLKEEVDLTSLINNDYHYELNECDHKFLDFLFAKLPEMIIIWDRIGFNEVTKLQRLDKFYTQLMVGTFFLSS